MHSSLRPRTSTSGRTAGPGTGLRSGAAKRTLAALGLALAPCLLACAEPTPQAPPADAAPATATAAATADPAASLASLWAGKAPPEWKYDFKDPGPGPRAPVTLAFEAEVGSAMFPEIEALVARRGLKCADTSIRAMMDKRRETEKARIADAKARGEDAVTAASWVNKRSKREANPQLRFSCPKVASDQLQDRPRVPSSGRLLYVFDGAEYPLRHTSYQRTTGDQALALKDFEDTVAHFTRLYGAPTKTFKNPLPTPDKDGKVEFPTAMNFETSWEFADLLARVNVLRYGDLVTIGERVEVPHGLRPDAPRFVDGKLLPPRPAPAGAPTPAADAPAGTPTPATTAPAGAATPATTAPAAPQSSAPATPTSKP